MPEAITKIGDVDRFIDNLKLTADKTKPTVSPGQEQNAKKWYTEELKKISNKDVYANLSGVQGRLFPNELVVIECAQCTSTKNCKEDTINGKFYCEQC